MKFAILEMLLHLQISGCNLVHVYHSNCNYKKLCAGKDGDSGHFTRVVSGKK